MFIMQKLNSGVSVKVLAGRHDVGTMTVPNIIIKKKFAEIISNSVKFTDFDINLDRAVFHKYFSQFGKVSRLFLHPEGKFGQVFFDTEEESNQAYYNSITSPTFFTLQKRPNDRQVYLDRSWSSNSSIDTMDFIATKEVDTVDIFGRVVEILTDDNGLSYVSLQDVKTCGYQLFDRQTFNKKLIPNEKILKQFHLYMLTKAKKFMLDNQRCISEKEIEDTIERCKHSIFETNNGNYQNRKSEPKGSWEKESCPNQRHLRRPALESQTSNGFGNLTRTVLNQTQSRSPQNYGNNRNTFTTRRRGNDITLNLSAVYEVIISHIVSETSCYVNLTANSELLERIAYDVNRLAVNGKAVEALIGHTYAAKLDGIWARAFVLSNTPNVEVLFIDSGVKKTVTETRTIPADLRTIPAQTILLKIKSQNVRLEVGHKYEIRPVQKLEEEGYLVEIRNSQRNDVSVRKPVTSSPRATPFSKFESKGSAPVVKELPAKNKEPIQKEMPFKNTEPTVIEVPNKNKEQSVKEVPPKDTSPTNKPLKRPLSALSNKTLIKSETPKKCVMDKIGSSGILALTEVVSPGTFVAYALSGDFSDELEELTNISAECVADPSFRPNIGDLVAVEKTDDDEKIWVRAVVINKKDNKYTCALVDYGVVESTEEVRRLPEKYKEIPGFCCVCTGNEIEKVIQGREDITYVVKSVKTVVITVDDAENTLIVESWNPFATSKLAYKEEKVFKDPLNIVTLNDGETVKINGQDTDGIMYVRTKACAEALKATNEYLSSFETIPLQSAPVVGQIVIAPFQGEPRRAVVKSIENSKIEVRFADYGRQEFVDVRDLSNVDENLVSFKCGRIPVPPLKNHKLLSAKALEYLDQNSNARYIAVVCNGNSEIDFKLLDGRLLSEVITDLEKPAEVPAESPTKVNEAASTSVTNTPSKPEVVTPSESEVATASKSEVATPSTSEVAASASDKVLHSELPELIVKPGTYDLACSGKEDVLSGFVTFMYSSEDTVDEFSKMTEDINTFVENNNEAYAPQSSEVCIANFEGMWYRGVALNCEDDEFVIFFIDFGNSSSVKKNDIRKFPKHLKSFPPTAMICSLSGLPDPEKDAALYVKLNELIAENEMYSVEVVRKNSDGSFDIKIPEIYKKLELQ